MDQQGRRVGKSSPANGDWVGRMPSWKLKFAKPIQYSENTVFFCWMDINRVRGMHSKKKWWSWRNAQVQIHLAPVKYGVPTGGSRIEYGMDVELLSGLALISSAIVATAIDHGNGNRIMIDRNKSLHKPTWNHVNLVNPKPLLISWKFSSLWLRYPGTRPCPKHSKNPNLRSNTKKYWKQKSHHRYEKNKCQNQTMFFLWSGLETTILGSTIRP